MQKYLKILTWPHHIPIHNLPLEEKMRKVSKLGVWLPHTLNEKKKKYYIFIVKVLISRQRNEPFIKNIIKGDKK